MRDYGRVHCAFWTSQDMRSLSEDARALALYLLTSPHGTIVGVCRLPDGYVCEDLQWVPERVDEGFRELSSKGFANRCDTTKWVWICKFLDWNQPENPNQWKAARRVAGQVPAQCVWKANFLDVLAHLQANQKAPKKKGSKTVKKPFRNQDQDQDQDQEKKNKKEECAGSDSKSGSESESDPPKLPAAPDPIPDEPPNPTDEERALKLAHAEWQIAECGRYAKSLRESGMSVNWENPILTRWVHDGYLLPMVVEALKQAKLTLKKSDGIAPRYVDAIVRDPRRQGIEEPTNVAPFKAKRFRGHGS